MAKSKSPKPKTIDQYIAQQPPKVRVILQKIRTTIQKAAPQATEKLSYRMPAFFFKGALVYYGAFKAHIGFYPPIRDARLKEEAKQYANERGNLRFPLDKSIPYKLITKLTKARVIENVTREAMKRAKRR